MAEKVELRKDVTNVEKRDRLKRAIQLHGHTVARFSTKFGISYYRIAHYISGGPCTLSEDEKNVISEQVAMPKEHLFEERD